MVRRIQGGLGGGNGEAVGGILQDVCSRSSCGSVGDESGIGEGVEERRELREGVRGKIRALPMQLCTERDNVRRNRNRDRRGNIRDVLVVPPPFPFVPWQHLMVLAKEVRAKPMSPGSKASPFAAHTFAN